MLNGTLFALYTNSGIYNIFPLHIRFIMIAVPYLIFYFVNGILFAFVYKTDTFKWALLYTAIDILWKAFTLKVVFYITPDINMILEAYIGIIQIPFSFFLGICVIKLVTNPKQRKAAGGLGKP